MAAPYSAAPAPAPQVTAININGGGPAGPRRYRREANHLGKGLPINSWYLLKANAKSFDDKTFNNLSDGV